MSDRPIEDALIVAGGRGTRLQPLTRGLPKPLVPFCGAPFLEGVIRRLADAGIRHVRLIVGSDTTPFEAVRPSAERLGIDISTVPEPEPLDTAGGVRAVADTFDRAVAVLNGDILTDVDYRAVFARHRDSGAEATLVLTEVEDTSSYGVAVRDGTRITRFVEKPAPGTLPGQNAVNAGTYVLEPEVMLAHPEGRLSFERDVFPALLDRGGRVEGFVWEGAWQDLGTPERYLQGHRSALEGELDWPSLRDVPRGEDGVRIAAGADVTAGATIQGPVLVLEGATIAAGTTIGPNTVVGRDARIETGVVLRDSVLHDGVEVGTDVAVSELIAGRDSRIGAGAKLGRGVVLGAETEVGEGEILADDERRPGPRDLAYSEEDGWSRA